MGDLLGGSRVVRAVERLSDGLAGWVRGSRLYGWLTAEPDPEFIVIDLRETYTVGPVIDLLDRIGAWLGPRWRGSGPARLLARAAETASRTAASSRTVRVLEAVLLPPEVDERDR